MNIKDILDIEKENKDKIYLFKEGYFYRAYEMSAYFHLRVNSI